MKATLTREARQKIFLARSKEVARQMKKRGLSETGVLADYAEWRKGRRAMQRKFQAAETSGNG